jgi:hypothetical protein
MMPKLLNLCARDSGHEVMYSQLDRVLTVLQKTAADTLWDLMLHETERQGLAPLLHKHLDYIGWGTVQKQFKRLLQSLFLRSRHAGGIRNQAMQEILTAYDAAGIQVLLVKGIALANFAYSDPELRPMRDIDLLVSQDKLLQAQQILHDLGWRPEEHDLPDDYYHLPPLGKILDGLPVTIELHRNLLPLHARYPRWPLEKSWNAARAGRINGRVFHTLSLEDTLRSVYLHGFQAPLTYEPFRLIHVADMVTLTEKYLDVMNWEHIRKEEPTLPAVISRFHFLTPLQERVVNRLKLDIRREPDGIGVPYNGWPCRRLLKTEGKELMQLAKDTMWPSTWWMQVYHGHLAGFYYWQARLLEHPRMLWRWAKDYYMAEIKKQY